MNPISPSSSLPPVMPAAQEASKTDEAAMIIEQYPQENPSASGEEDNNPRPLKRRKIEPLPEVENFGDLPPELHLRVGDYLLPRDILNMGLVSTNFATTFSVKRSQALSRMIATNIVTLNMGWLEAKKDSFGLPNYAAVIREGLAFMTERNVSLTLQERTDAVAQLVEQKDLQFTTGESVGQAVETVLAQGPIRLVQKLDTMWKMCVAERSLGSSSLSLRASNLIKKLACQSSIKSVPQKEIQSAFLSITTNLKNAVIEGRLDLILSVLMDARILNPNILSMTVKFALLKGHFDILQAVVENRPIENFAQAVSENRPIDDFTIGRNSGELVIKALELLKANRVILTPNERGILLKEGFIRLDIGVMRAALNDGPIELARKLEILEKIGEVGSLDMMQLMFDHLPEEATDQHMRNDLAVKAAQNGYPEIVAAIRARGPLSDGAQEELNKIAAIETALLNHQELPEASIQRKLIMTARCGCLKEFKKILISNEPLAPEPAFNQPPPYQFLIDTVMIVSARHGRFDVLRQLFEVYYYGSQSAKYLALGVARQAGHWDVVKLLLNNNSIIARKDMGIRDFAIQDALREDAQRGGINGLAPAREYYNPLDSGSSW